MNQEGSDGLVMRVFSKFSPDTVVISIGTMSSGRTNPGIRASLMTHTSVISRSVGRMSQTTSKKSESIGNGNTETMK